MRPFGARHAWLSITPEPELELPRALATLRAGGPPEARLVESERTRAEALVLRGSRRAWQRYLADAMALAETAAPATPDGAGGPVREARELVEDVVHNHNQLELAL